MTKNIYKGSAYVLETNLGIEYVDSTFISYDEYTRILRKLEGGFKLRTGLPKYDIFEFIEGCEITSIEKKEGFLAYLLEEKGGNKTQTILYDTYEYANEALEYLIKE